MKPLITLRCLVDNTALRGSAFWGEHGVAFAIETPDGNLLFDTGQSGNVLVHNAEQMHIDFMDFDALVLSHAHYDHTGGLAPFFALSRPGIPLYANPDLFNERYALKDGKTQSIGLRLPRAEVARHANLHLSAEPAEIFPGVWTSGEISDRPDFNGRSSQHQIRVGETWQPDPYKDDLSLVLQTPQGLVVVCGCCHAGLLNTLVHIRRRFSKPVRAIIGGTHLTAASADDLERVRTALQDQGLGCSPELYLNHCTGEHAQMFLAQAFGEKMKPCPAGTELAFN
jgi:7,8-dihydropterin-6-yl-methyl-4-(beta-D-ribofuranosyl)aminobenzene 5'-phosphate synthase